MTTNYFDVVLAATVFVALTLAISGIGYVKDKMTRETAGAKFLEEFLKLPDAYNAARSKLAQQNAFTKQTKGMQPRQCSSECLCSNGGIEPYGRFCGYGYSSCVPDAEPCDPLDRCCSMHDSCTDEYGMSDCGCTISLIKCVTCVYANEFSPMPGYIQIGWRCNRTAVAIENIVSEFKFLSPNCFADSPSKKT